MNIRIFTSFVIILHIICIIKGQHRIIFPTINDQINNCIHTSGQPGLCVLFPKCQINLIGPDLNGNTCGFEGNSPKICCPDQNTKSGGVTLQVFSPKLNFECGEANLTQFDVLYHTTIEDNNYDYEGVATPQSGGFGGFVAGGFGPAAGFGPANGFGPATGFGPAGGLGPATGFGPTGGAGFGAGGGIETAPNEWPWAVLVGVQINLKDITWICTGSLINRKFILSAAHCQKRSPDKIRLGEHSILDDNDGASPLDRNIIHAFVNPHYETIPSYHDLVLYEMDYDVDFYDMSINPICLPWSDSKQQNYINKTMTGVGWGATEFGGEFSDVLLKADVQSFDTNVCDESYKTLPAYELNWPQGITEEFYICAGNQTASVDACEGDSGGPLMYKEGNKYFIGGVTSKGYGCGNSEFLGLYINVRNTRYLQWIKDIAF